MLIGGSHANGFAPRDGVPLYPSLWWGCVGAWCPSLGPTGTRLFDWSGYHRDGTLTNMTPATAWTRLLKRGGLDFDGSDDYVEMGTAQICPTRYGNTFCAWVKEVNQSLTYAQLMQFNCAGLYMGIGMYGATSSTWMYRPLDAGAISSGSNHAAPVIGEIAHIALRYVGASTFEFYRNGVLSASAGTTVGANGLSQNCLSRGYSTGRLTGTIDDVRVYQRLLSVGEIRLLATRPGIAYETRRKRRVSTGGAAPAAGNSNLLLLGVG